MASCQSANQSQTKETAEERRKRLEEYQQKKRLEAERIKREKENERPPFVVSVTKNSFRRSHNYTPTPKKAQSSVSRKLSHVSSISQLHILQANCLSETKGHLSALFRSTSNVSDANGSFGLNQTNSQDRCGFPKGAHSSPTSFLSGQSDTSEITNRKEAIFADHQIFSEAKETPTTPSRDSKSLQNSFSIRRHRTTEVQRLGGTIINGKRNRRSIVPNLSEKSLWLSARHSHITPYTDRFYGKIVQCNVEAMPKRALFDDM